MTPVDKSLPEVLAEALSKSQDLVKQLEDQTEIIDRLFRENSAKDAEITSLKKSLRASQAKERKWRLEKLHLSSPVMSNDVEPPAHVLRSSTPGLTPSRYASPKSSPQVQVHLSPPRKRQRIEARERTPLHEVQTNTKSLPSAKDRLQKAIEAIPSLAEDGDWDRESRTTSTKEQAGDRQGAHARLGILLDAPPPQNNVLGRRPNSMSPKARNDRVPSFGRSSSDTGSSEQQPVRRRPRFLPPKPVQRKDDTPLRSRPIGSLNLSDFVLRAEFLEEWEKPRARGTVTLGQDRISEEQLLLDYLGPGAKEKLANMTARARENLLHDARLKKMVSNISEAKKASEETVTAPGFWSIDFLPSQEEERHRLETEDKLREEVRSRQREAVRADGRWRFRDE